MGLLRTYGLRALALASLACAGGCLSLRLGAPLDVGGEGWPMDGRTMERQRWTPTPVRPPLVQEWSFDIAAGTGAWSPVVVDSIVFVSTLRGELFALNASSGKRLGKTSFGSPITGSPLPRRNLILVPLSGPGESLAAYDAVRASVVWRGKYGDVELTPLMIDRRIFFGTTTGTFACVDRESGDLIWTYAIPDNRRQKGVRSTPASDGKLVIFGADDGVIYALDAENGRPTWTHATGAPVHAGIALSDSTVIAAAIDGIIVALDVRSGAERWRTVAGAPVRSAAAIAGGLAIVGTSAGGVMAVRLDTGAPAWTADTDGPIAAPPTIAGSYVYVGTLGRELLALDLKDGAILWRERLPGRIKSSAASAHGMLYVTTDDQQLLAFRGSIP
jgi:outer membrane protein assembly factor BamB